jgi:hypothetical protein
MVKHMYSTVAFTHVQVRWHRTVPFFMAIRSHVLAHCSRIFAPGNGPPSNVAETTLLGRRGSRANVEGMVLGGVVLGILQLFFQGCMPALAARPAVCDMPSNI